MITLRTFTSDTWYGTAYYAAMYLENGVTIDLYYSDIPGSILIGENETKTITPEEAELICPGCTTFEKVAVTAIHPDSKIVYDIVYDKKGYKYFSFPHSGKCVKEDGTPIRFDETTGRLWHINEEGEEYGFEPVSEESEKA